jgi:hypothetical protein
MSQNVVIKAAGIHTNNSPFANSPDGSMSEAVNVVIDRSEIIEPRRGFYQYNQAVFDATAKQLINYKDRILAHVGEALKYDYDGQGMFLDFTGDDVNEAETGRRIRSIESNGNLYFTSDGGIKKLAASSSSDFYDIEIENAGGIKAIDLEGETDYSSLGFLEPNSKVAYRLVFCKNDINDNLIQGSPSSRVIVYNITETQSCKVSLTFTLPDTITEDYYYQIYRTGLSTETYGTEPTDPGDEMYLVLEDDITSADIVAGSITVSDITSDDFRRSGALLYTNPVSGEGITQANEPPPFAKDICLYKGFTFLANTRTVQRLNLAFLTVSGLTSNVSTVSILDGTTTETYTFRGTKETFTINYSGSVAADFIAAAAAPGKYFKLHSAMDERKYYVWFYDAVNQQTDPAVAGYIGIKVTVAAADTTDVKMTAAATAINNFTDDFNVSINTGTDVLTVACANNGDVSAVASTNTITGLVWSQDGLGTGQDAATDKVFLPRIPSSTENGPTTAQQLEQVAKSFVSVLNASSSIVSAYYMSGFDDVPGQILLEQRATTGPAFYINASTGSIFNPTVPLAGSTVISSNEIRPNRIYYSKYQQPDAYPLVNFIDIGPKDREIKRIIPLRDALFVLKEDGIYKITGDTAVSGSSNFSVSEFDFSAQVLASDTAVVLNNTIYALSTQGVITITDTGVSVISRPIENQILKIIREGSNYKTASFGVAYESDRAYILYTIDPSDSSSEVATQAFRYNTFTNTWTKLDQSKTCGLVNFADDKLYLGASDINAIEIERKDLSRIDYADREHEIQIQTDGVDSTENTIQVSSVSDAEIGDVLFQRQYLTGSQFNRLLTRLDTDPLLPSGDYMTDLEFTAGKNIRTLIVSLAQKLDGDVGGTVYEDLVDNYSYTATAISAATSTVITLGAHDIEVGRYITISGSNCSPSINGTWEVTAVGATTVTIDREVKVAGTTATVQTAVQKFEDVQVCYNLIVNRLNTDPGVYYTNYLESSGYVDYELVVKNKTVVGNLLHFDAVQDFMAGEAYILDSIESIVIYNPQFFSDPSVEKQVSEGTFMFENSNFSLVTVSYASDKSPSFVSIDFEKDGNGDFGGFSWGNINFGGVAAPIPLRTYIPMAKQRCRFINVKFKHKVALEKFSLYGVSLTFRPYNIRVSK